MKSKLVFIGIIAVLGISIYLLFNLYRKEAKNSERIYSNFETFVKKAKFSIDSSSSVVRQMTLEKNELKELFPDIVNRLDKMDIKLRNVETYQQIGLNISKLIS